MVTPVGSAKTFFPSASPQAPEPREVEPREPVVVVDPTVIGVGVQEVLAPFNEKYGPALAQAVCTELKIDSAGKVSGQQEGELREALRISEQVMGGVRFLDGLRSTPTPR